MTGEDSLLRSEEGESLGLEPGPSRLQKLVQRRSDASRGQNAPGGSASPAPALRLPALHA